MIIYLFKQKSLGGVHNTVASNIKKYVFNYDEMKYKERFHMTDVDSTGRLKKTKRGILIKSSFLDNYQEDF